MTKIKHLILILSIAFVAAYLWIAVPIAQAQEPDTDPHDDAFIAPDLPSAGGMNQVADVATSTTVTPTYYQTSEYMAGSVAVGIVLLESDGSVDSSTEDWTEAEKHIVFNEIVDALNWWVELEPRANLSFVYDDHFTTPLTTSVEPISRPYSDQKYWIADAMSALGYDDSSYFSNVRDYDNDLRATYQTDWAFTIFVVDSSADADNSFNNGHSAYAYLGGPFMVMTYGNSGYGPNNMDAVAAHEIGHIFQALDQYAGAQQPCTHSSGYLNVENQNSQYGDCASNVSSIMRSVTGPYRSNEIDEYASGQIGWRDSDGDDILDPLDTELPISIDNIVIDGNSVVVSGTTEIIPYPSPLRTAATINTLTNVQYRFDGGDWQQAIAQDGAFDGTNESYQFADTLSPGLHTLQVAALDSAANVSDAYITATITILDPVDGGLNTEFSSTESDASASGVSAGDELVLLGTAYHLEGIVASVEYQIDGGLWQSANAQDGAFDSDYESFTLAIDTQDVEIGTHLIQARAIDADGNTEINVASQEIEIIAQVHTISLPLVMNSIPDA